MSDNRLVATIGRNVRAIRQRSGMTQHEFARHLSTDTYVWSQSRLALLELGRRQDLDISDAFQLIFAVGRPIGEIFADCDLSMIDGIPQELMDNPPAGDPWTAATPILEAIITLDVGDGTEDEPHDTPPEQRAEIDTHADRPIADQPKDADRRLAKRLGIPIEEVIDAAVRRYGRTLTTERNIRAEVAVRERGAERARERGNQTRLLSQQLIFDIGPSNIEALK